MRLHVTARFAPATSALIRVPSCSAAARFLNASHDAAFLRMARHAQLRQNRRLASLTPSPTSRCETLRSPMPRRSAAEETPAAQRVTIGPSSADPDDMTGAEWTRARAGKTYRGESHVTKRGRSGNAPASVKSKSSPASARPRKATRPRTTSYSRRTRPTVPKSRSNESKHTSKPQGRRQRAPGASATHDAPMSAYLKRGWGVESVVKWRVNGRGQRQVLVRWEPSWEPKQNFPRAELFMFAWGNKVAAGCDARKLHMHGLKDGNHVSLCALLDSIDFPSAATQQESSHRILTAGHSLTDRPKGHRKSLRNRWS